MESNKEEEEEGLGLREGRQSTLNAVSFRSFAGKWFAPASGFGV